MTNPTSSKSEPFALQKNLVTRIKRQVTDREEMFANHIPAKELVPVMCKELSSTMMMMINKHMIDMTDRYIDMIGSLI